MTSQDLYDVNSSFIASHSVDSSVSSQSSRFEKLLKRQQQQISNVDYVPYFLFFCFAGVIFPILLLLKMDNVANMDYRDVFISWGVFFFIMSIRACIFCFRAVKNGLQRHFSFFLDQLRNVIAFSLLIASSIILPASADGTHNPSYSYSIEFILPISALFLLAFPPPKKSEAHAELVEDDGFFWIPTTYARGPICAIAIVFFVLLGLKLDGDRGAHHISFYFIFTPIFLILVFPTIVTTYAFYYYVIYSRSQATEEMNDALLNYETEEEENASCYSCLLFIVHLLMLACLWALPLLFVECLVSYDPYMTGSDDDQQGTTDDDGGSNEPKYSVNVVSLPYWGLVVLVPVWVVFMKYFVQLKKEMDEASPPSQSG